MNIKNIHLAYFSATFSTKRIVREIASQFQKPVIEYDITSDVLKDDVSLGSDGDLLIVCVPSYAGRVPSLAVPPKSVRIPSLTRNTLSTEAVKLLLCVIIKIVCWKRLEALVSISITSWLFLLCPCARRAYSSRETPTGVYHMLYY